MKYILDFDHTLYEVSRFKEDAASYKTDGTWVTPAIWDILDAKNYFYEDVFSFIQKQGKGNVTILTAMTPSLGPLAREFQKAKLEKSGIAALVGEIVFMEGEKGPFVKDLYDNTPTVFVDDTFAHLVSAKQHCPDVHAVQMVRPGLEDRGEISTSPSIPVISSLRELIEIFT